MNYTPDANEMAARYARKEREYEHAPGPGYSTPVVRGTLTVWASLEEMSNGISHIAQSLNVHLDLSKPGLIIAYDEQSDAEIFAIKPGWYFNFVPDREGE